MIQNASDDVIVIGSGIGGLCCAALLARYGFSVTVYESHSLAGGAAHAFSRQGFMFDSGPSLHSGISYSPSANPLRQVLDAIGEELPCETYDTWGCWLPEGQFDMAVGAEPFYQVLSQLRGKKAAAEWRELQRVMAPLKEASVAIPPIALRADWRIAQTVSRFAPKFFSYAKHIGKLIGPFSHITDGVIEDTFTRNWLNLLCFMLSGLPADSTLGAEMAFMFADWYRPGVVLDYPRGGGGALIEALVRGFKRYGGKLRFNSHVEEIIVENQRAIAIKLTNGEKIQAKKAIVSNASIWDTLKLLPEQSLPQKFRFQREQIPACDSFMHLHLGIDASGIASDLPCHHLVVNNWEQGITSPQNVVAVSIPSLLDSSLAPPGKHTIHAYTPATEPYELWKGLDRRSDTYQNLKETRSQVLWQALDQIIPNIRDRSEVTLIGTPLTHQRFLRRYRGSYGPAIAAGKGRFPGVKTPIAGLFCCGDSTFPGIGVPAVAASGMLVANTLAPVSEHLKLLDHCLA